MPSQTIASHSSMRLPSENADAILMDCMDYMDWCLMMKVMLQIINCQSAHTRVSDSRTATQRFMLSSVILTRQSMIRLLKLQLAGSSECG